MDIKRYLKSHFVLLLYTTIIFSFAMVVFIENFVYSKTFGILCLRCIDDVAFQFSLHKYHAYKGIQLLCMNDYGYGWIYWFPMTLITWPLQFLAESVGIVWPLIVVPRMISLVFSVGCSILAYKIANVFTKNKWIVFSVAILMPLFPAGGYFAGRFGTVAQVAFFSMLSFYTVIKYQRLEEKTLWLALFYFALSMGTKVSSVVMAPMLALVIMNRYEWSFSRKNLFVFLRQIIIAVIEMVFFISPALFLVATKFDVAKESANLLSMYFTANRGHNANGIIDLYLSAMKMAYPLWLVLVLTLMLILLSIMSVSKWRENELLYRDLFVVGIGEVVGMAYLCLTIPTGGVYIFMYSTAISFALPFGIILFDFIRVKNNICQRLIIVALVMVSISTMLIGICIKVNRKTPFNILTYYQSKDKNEKEAQTIDNLSKLISATKFNHINLYIDNAAPITVCNWYENRNLNEMYMIYDDMGNIDADRINLIILSRNAIGFYQDDKFNKEISKREDNEHLIVDRNNRKNLLQMGTYGGYSWEEIFSDDDVVGYKRNG